MENEIYDVIVIGGGIVGLSSAYKINEAFPGLKVLVLEKEDQVSAHQTGHNSGVIHSGLYYKPGSYKAKNCVEGRRELVAFAREHHIPHDICGKIVVATDTAELPHLNKIYNNGLQNGVEGVEKISADTIREIEPNCVGIEGLWVPCTGIIDFPAVAHTLSTLLSQRFGHSKVLTNQQVIAFEHHTDYTEVITQKTKFKARNIISCAGLQADRVAKEEGVDPELRIVGFRGDYYELTKEARHKVKNLIYPVPNPEFPFLGVHFTRMTDGTVECGPNAVFVFKREGYGKTDFNINDTFDAISYKGTWKLFGKHWRYGLEEYKRAFSKKLFLKTLQRLVPSLQMEDIEPGRAGVRAMALDKEGNMIDDFKIVHSKNAIHVLNAPSPAATACLAIGSAVKDLASEKFNLS